MNDMDSVTAPKSDQQNYENFLGGKTLTIKITKVTIKAGEQPITINFENDNGKPYKPCKSMAKVMVVVWGNDSSKYTGRSLTLYGDPTVTWGGMAVGGIRISHMSHIDAPVTMALAATRASKKLFTVKSLVVSNNESEGSKLSKEQQTELVSQISVAKIDPAEFKAAFGVKSSLGELKISQLPDIAKWIDGKKPSNQPPCEYCQRTDGHEAACPVLNDE
jgi:hypothetical protein